MSIKRREIVTFGSIISLDSMTFGLIAPILAPLLKNPNIFLTMRYSPFIQYCLYGFLLAISSLSYMLSAPLLGYASDHVGRKRILLFCATLFLLSYLGYIFAFKWHSLIVFALARVLGGIGAASQGVAQAGALDSATVEDKHIAISYVAIGMTMGLVIGPLLSTLWREDAFWVPFVIVLFVTILVWLLIYFFVPNAHITRDNLFENVSHLKNSFWLCMVFFCFELGFSLFYQALPLLLSVQHGMTNVSVGYFSTYTGTVLAVCLFFGVRIGRKILSRRNLILITFTLGIGTIVLFAVNNNLLTLSLLTLPILFTVAVLYPSLIDEITSVEGAENTGFIMGVTDALLALAFTMSGLLSGFLYYYYFCLPFFVAGLFWIVGFYFYRSHVRQNTY